MLKHMFLGSLYNSPKLHCGTITLLADSALGLYTPPHPPGLQLSLLICSFFIYGVRHTNWRGYMKHLFLYSILHETAIKWWVHKSLLEWGFRCNLVCFSQSQRCTDYNNFFHCSLRARVGYCLLWTAICLIKNTWIKLILLLLRNKLVFTSHWNTGNLSIVT